MSAQRRVTAPPYYKAEVVTESVRVDGLRKTIDPFREAPPVVLGRVRSKSHTKNPLARLLQTPSSPDLRERE